MFRGLEYDMNQESVHGTEMQDTSTDPHLVPASYIIFNPLQQIRRANLRD